jgi:hypothetical protein
MERVVREFRLLILRADIGPDKTASLTYRVRGCLHPVAESGVAVIGRVQDSAVRGELPAVVKAPDAALLDPAQGERRATVHAPFVQDSHLSRGVAEHHERLAEQAGPQRVGIRLR